MENSIKCQKCRNILLIDVNSETLKTKPCDPTNCVSYDEKTLIFLIEEKLPNWVKKKVEEEQWTKGKLHCPSCGSKVGSFDFISGRKCNCGSSVLPSVHFISSQVDRPINIII